MGQFDWGTEDDHVWDDKPPGPDDLPPARRSLTARLLLLLVVISLLAAVGWGGYYLAYNRVETVSRETEEAVLASYELVRAASQDNDGELFTNLISGRSPTWVTAQQKLVREQLWFDRPALSLTYSAAFAASPPPTITLSSDLNTATVETMVTYAYGADSIPVQLQQTELYRRGQNGWLLSPLDTEVWRSTARFESDLIEATFPLPDQEIGRRLTQDLSQMLANLCDRYFELSCPDDSFPLRLKFSLDPDTLLEIDRLSPRNLLSSGRAVELPAPTLVGRPIDETGYQALFDGYSQLLYTAWVIEEEENYWGLLNYNLRLSKIAADLRLRSASPYTSPIDRLTGSAVNLDRMQDVGLLCLNEQGIELRRQSNDETAEPILLSTDFQATHLYIDADDQRLALQGVLENEDEIRLWPLDVQSEAISIDFDMEPNDIVEMVSHPDGARLMISPSEESRQPLMVTVNCGSRSCFASQSDLFGRLIWSPDGLFTATVRDIIFLGNAQGLPIRYLGDGSTAHWIDEETLHFLGFTSGSEDPSRSRVGTKGLWEFTIGFDQPELLVDGHDLVDLLPEEDQPLEILILSAIPLEGSRTLLFATDRSVSTFYQFVYDRALDEATLVWSDREPQLYSFFPSPDGRYLVQNIIEEGVTTLQLHNLLDGQIRRIGRALPELRDAAPETVTLDWSLDGRQLLILARGRLLVYDVPTDTLFDWPAAESATPQTCFDAKWIAAEK